VPSRTIHLNRWKQPVNLSLRGSYQHNGAPWSQSGDSQRKGGAVRHICTALVTAIGPSFTEQSLARKSLQPSTRKAAQALPEGSAIPIAT